eukprot:TRINITY_DN7955_c0_g1_i1.p1 TRINITY_DN7955_c0_g1~~TRINITY_DN7955_c0_g1_i1.p1  ORF type:complete len:448 (+),score=108.18 TRINITY_DN7955_c0_g1_i1:90-1433(+)
MCIRDSSRIAWLVVAFVGVVHAAEEHKCAAKGCSGGPSTLKMQLREHWGKKSVEVPTANTGLVVVDMWAYHWCKTFAHRSGALVPRMEASLSLARSMGITIIFAPSTVTSAFEGHPRREASLALTKEWLWRPKFPFSGRPAAPAYSCMCGSSSSCQQNFGEAEQFQGLAVHDTDFIVGGINCDEEPCPDTAEILSVATAMNLSTLLYAGVASNVCVIDKPFGMERLARFGFRTVFLRDLAQPQMAWDQERGPDYTSAEVDSFIEKWVASSTSFEQSALASGWALPTELSHGGYITLAPWGTWDRPHIYEAGQLAVWAGLWMHGQLQHKGLQCRTTAIDAAQLHLADQPAGEGGWAGCGPKLSIDGSFLLELRAQGVQPSTAVFVRRSPALVTQLLLSCLLYTSDAADEEDSVDLGGRRILKKKNRSILRTSTTCMCHRTELQTSVER